MDHIDDIDEILKDNIADNWDISETNELIDRFKEDGLEGVKEFLLNTTMHSWILEDKAIEYLKKRIAKKLFFKKIVQLLE